MHILESTNFCGKKCTLMQYASTVYKKKIFVRKVVRFILEPTSKVQFEEIWNKYLWITKLHTYADEVFQLNRLTRKLSRRKSYNWLLLGGFRSIFVTKLVVNISESLTTPTGDTLKEAQGISSARHTVALTDCRGLPPRPQATFIQTWEYTGSLVCTTRQLTVHTKRMVPYE